MKTRRNLLTAVVLLFAAMVYLPSLDAAAATFPPPDEPQPLLAIPADEPQLDICLDEFYAIVLRMPAAQAVGWHFTDPTDAGYEWTVSIVVTADGESTQLDLDNPERLLRQDSGPMSYELAPAGDEPRVVEQEGVTESWYADGRVEVAARVPGIVTGCTETDTLKICVTRVVRPDGTVRFFLDVYVKDARGRWVRCLKTGWFWPLWHRAASVDMDPSEWVAAIAAWAADGFETMPAELRALVDAFDARAAQPAPVPDDDAAGVNVTLTLEPLYNGLPNHFLLHKWSYFAVLANAPTQVRANSARLAPRVEYFNPDTGAWEPRNISMFFYQWGPFHWTEEYICHGHVDNAVRGGMDARWAAAIGGGGGDGREIGRFGVFNAYVVGQYRVKLVPEPGANPTCGTFLRTPGPNGGAGRSLLAPGAVICEFDVVSP